MSCRRRNRQLVRRAKFHLRYRIRMFMFAANWLAEVIQAFAKGMAEAAKCFAEVFKVKGGAF